MSSYIGEISGLLTSVCFSSTSTFFTLAGRRVGSVVVNRIRLIIAIIFLTIAHLVLGKSLPVDIEGERWFWLGLSGLIGLVLGDAFLFQAFILIGPRLSMLLMSLVPIISSISAWVFLGETLKFVQLVAILITIGGIAWVILERNGGSKTGNLDNRDYLKGILFGLAGATGQALGLITAKKGLGGDFNALTGTLMRMLVAVTFLWIITILRGQSKQTIKMIASNPRAFLFIIFGAFSGPFLGVTFSLVAIQNTEIGIASTLMALPPVILLPISKIFFNENISIQGVLGTILALAGVAVLFLV